MWTKGFQIGATQMFQTYLSYSLVLYLANLHTGSSASLSAGNISRNPASRCCPALPAIQPEVPWYPQIIFQFTSVSFYLLLLPKKGSLCPSWPDLHTEVSFPSGCYSVQRAQTLQQCASCLYLQLKCASTYCMICLECCKRH